MDVSVLCCTAIQIYGKNDWCRGTHIYIYLSVLCGYTILCSGGALMCQSSISSQTEHRHRNGGMRGEEWVGREGGGGGGGGELRHIGEERAGV